MHHCLYISEVLSLIFTSVANGHLAENGSYEGITQIRVRQKTLASLARTCHLLSSPALDLLWHELHTFHPLLKMFPMAASSVDDPEWLIFRSYANRVKIMHVYEGVVSAQFKKELTSALQRHPDDCFPLLPNVTMLRLEWRGYSHAVLQDLEISLLGYFAGPAVTTIELSLLRWPTLSSVKLEGLADLPKLWPNVTSFSLALPPQDYEPCREVGRMISQWPRLRTLRTCAIPQPEMDQLFSRQTLEFLYIDNHMSAPFYNGRIPDTVRELTLDVVGCTLCMRFLQTVYASPTKFHLVINTKDGQQEENVDEVFHLLPRRLDTSLLLSLTIQPKAKLLGIPMEHSLELRQSLVFALVEFRALRELDLDCVCTAQMSDTDIAYLARSLTFLQHLQLGTATESVARPQPTASIGAVIEVLRYCQHLETLHIAFDGSIPPPGPSSMQDGNVVLSEELVCRGWGVSNRRITNLCVGYSPIGDVTIDAVAFCLKSIMPCLAQIGRKDWYEEWGLIQDMLESR